MDSVYTTTITDEARRRGIEVEVIDARTPIFILKYKGKKIRCHNSLTDRVGAVTFHLTQNKHLANSFLRNHGFPVPAQQLFTTFRKAEEFLTQHRSIVVKPCTQWGGRGVSVNVKTTQELRYALRKARRYEESVVLEEYVAGVDKRLIFVDYHFIAAIQRDPASVVGNGRDTVRTLIRRKNNIAGRADPSNVVPLDRETHRTIAALGLNYDSVPGPGRTVQVRLTSNYHTGGTIALITDSVSHELINTGMKIVHLAELPVAAVDFLVEHRGSCRIIELAPDLAISPPEGRTVAQHFLDYLFPGSRVE